MKNKYHTCKLNHSWFCFIAQASSFCYHMIHWFLQKNDIYFYCLLLCYEGASAHFVSVCVFNQINVVTEYSVCRDCHHTSQIWKFCQPTTSEKTSFISFWRFWLSLYVLLHYKSLSILNVRSTILAELLVSNMYVCNRCLHTWHSKIYDVALFYGMMLNVNCLLHYITKNLENINMQDHTILCTCTGQG